MPTNTRSQWWFSLLKVYPHANLRASPGCTNRTHKSSNLADNPSMKSLSLIAPVLAVLAIFNPMAAQTCTTTPGGAVPDGTVSANATFATGDGFITISVTNQLADP